MSTVGIDHLLDGARRAEGTVVIIDVFRAFTTAAVAFSRGARKILLATGVDEALALRDAGLADLVMGEEAGCRPEGFDFGNSPFELSAADVDGAVIAHSTRAGTAGICAAERAEVLYAGSFVVARATAEVLRREAPERITVVAMGLAGSTRTEEDDECARYLAALTRGERPDPEPVRRRVLESPEAAKFGDPERPWFHPGDRDIALDIDRYDFAIRVTREERFLVAQPIR